MRKKLVILSGLIAVNSLSYASGYDWQTPTENNWHVVIANGEMNYADGTILGGNGTAAAPEPSVISADKGGVAKIISPGTLNLIVRPKPGMTHSWLYGVYAYSSTGGTTTSQTTELTFDTKLNVDMETSVSQNTGGESLGAALDITAHATDGTVPGAGAITKANFNDDVNIKVVNKTETTGSGWNPSSVEGISMSSFSGGRNEVVFNKKLDISGSVDTQNKHIYGIRYEDQKENGKGSLLLLKGDTSINVESLHGGRAWGVISQAAGGTQSFETEKGTALKIRTVQKGGQNYAEAPKFNAFKMNEGVGSQNVNIQGAADITSEGDYYAVSVATNVIDNSRQKIVFGDELAATAASTKFCYGLRMDSKNEGVSDITVAKDLRIEAASGSNAYGIYGTSEAAGHNSLAVNGKGDIKTLSESSWAYGIYNFAKTGGIRNIAFNDGLIINASSIQESAVAIRAFTDGYEGGMSKVTAEGNIDINANDGIKGWAAWSDGNGSEIALNQAGRGLVKGEGISFANNSGRILWNLNKSGSVLKGNLGAQNNGFVELKMEQEGTVYIGAATNNQGNASGKIDIRAINGSVWKMTGDSSVTNVVLNNGALIDMTYASGFQKIETDDLQGVDGMFKLDIDASTNVDNSDRIYVKGMFTGSQYLDLNEVGHGNLDGAEGTVLATVNNNNGTFLAKDGEGTLYWKRYELDKQVTADTSGNYTTDWYLKKITNIENPTTSTEIINASNGLNYHTWRTENDKLLQRMGELRHNGEESKGAWFRVKGSKIGRGGKFGFDNKYTAYELGYDEVAKRTVDKTRYQGAAISYTDGSSSYSRGSGDNSSKAISFYNTEIGSKGHYLDLVLKISNMDNDFTVYDTNSNKITGDFNNTGVALSAEYGRKNALKNGWYIEPQAQFTLGYLGGDSYTASNGIEVNQSGIKNTVGRVGFNIGKEIGSKGIFYAKANLLHEFGGSYNVTMTDSTGRVKVSDSFNDTWFEYGVGAAFASGKNSHVYFDVERSSGSDFTKDWQWNIGARWSF